MRPDGATKGIMLALAIGVLLAAEPGSYASQLDLSGAGGLVTIPEDPTVPTPERHARNGTGRLGVTFFPGRVEDDESPLSLQPYLQRASTAWFQLLAEAFSVDVPAASEPYSGSGLGASIGGERTIDVLVLSAAASFERIETHAPGGPDVTYLLPTLQLAPGLRFGDTRILLGYRAAPIIRDGTYDGRGWGELFLELTHVAARTVQLDALGQTLLGGGRGVFAIHVSPTPELQLGGSFEIAQGALFFDTDARARRIQGGFDVSWWLSRAWRLELAYRLVGTRPADAPDTPQTVEHRLGVGVGVRMGW